MTSLDPIVLTRARRAYERGRLWLGARRVWPIAFLVPAALWLHSASAERIALVAAMKVMASLWWTSWTRTTLG
jgi:hypothetical protein